MVYGSAQTGKKCAIFPWASCRGARAMPSTAHCCDSWASLWTERIIWAPLGPDATLRRHSVWKSPNLSYLSFSILAFSTNFCPIKIDLSGNTVDFKLQKLAKMDHFWLTFVHSKCKCSSLRSQCWMRLFCDFQTLCAGSIARQNCGTRPDGSGLGWRSEAHELLWGHHWVGGWCWHWFRSIALSRMDASLHSGGHADPAAQILPSQSLLLTSESWCRHWATHSRLAQGTVFENHPKCRIWMAFSINFWPIKTDLSGNSVWPQALGFQKLAKLDHFWHFLMNFCPLQM